MLFTTPTFVLMYLPLALAGFYALGRWSVFGAAAWLWLMSLLFYSHWRAIDTLLLLGSIAVNFAIAQRIAAVPARSRPARAWLALGIAIDLGLLAWFKYAVFAMRNLNLLPGVDLPSPDVVLPIGISFYTFTQIAFLVDTYQGKVRESQPVHYGLFVTYFPHLVAGPVLHHAQMMPQFAKRSIYRADPVHLVGGLAIFAIGLTKKIVFADGIAPYADAVFKAADHGASPTTSEAWIGALAYTLQLYFDFSGYSDMAIGLSWMFNVRLPYNFNSPYKSLNISEFWRRWHISLSTFLRDYLYIAMGGNRLGPARRYVNLFITMVLGGLWHGANWTFVAWGALHGTYLMVHHAFRASVGEGRLAALQRHDLARAAAWALTMLAVVAAWVLFRAETFVGAIRILVAMAGSGAARVRGIDPVLWNAGLDPFVGAAWCAALGLIVVSVPNSNRIGERLLALAGRGPVACGLIAGAALGLVALLVTMNATRDAVSAFIYFNF